MTAAFAGGVDWYHRSPRASASMILGMSMPPDILADRWRPVPAIDVLGAKCSLPVHGPCACPRFASG